MSHLLQTNVGILVNLWLFWRSADLAIANIRAGNGERLVFGIGYAVLAVFFFIVLLVSLFGV